MPWLKSVDPSLKMRLRATEAERLVQLLAELCITDRGVARRVDALLLADDPAALTEALHQRILAIAPDDYIDEGQASDYANQLGAILDDIGCHLLPRDPLAALRLTARFIASDAKVFENMDDSGNDAGAVFERAAELFHIAAHELNDPPVSQELMRKLLSHDDYGVRDFLQNPRARL